EELRVVEVPLVDGGIPDVVCHPGRGQLDLGPGLAAVELDRSMDRRVPVEEVVVVARERGIRAVDSAFDLVGRRRCAPEERPRRARQRLVPGAAEPNERSDKDDYCANAISTSKAGTHARSPSS